MAEQEIIIDFLSINKLIKNTRVAVQTQTELWPDPLERTPVCFQTKITGSEQHFERKIVWAMV